MIEHACVTAAYTGPNGRGPCLHQWEGFSADHYCAMPPGHEGIIHQCSCGQQWQSDGGWIDMFYKELFPE